MTNISEEDIKIRAYALWEASGHLDGNHDAHWLEALRQLTEEADAADAAEAPAATSKLSVVKNDTVSEPVAKKRGKSA